MKKYLLTSIVISMLIIIGVLLTSCSVFLTSRDAGPVTTNKFDLKDFNAVEVGDGFALNIVAADTYDIEVTSNENLLKNITVAKDGQTLKIGHKWQGIFGFFSNSIEVKITMPELAGLTVSDGVNGTIRGFKSTRETNIQITGGSRIDLDLETGSVIVKITDGSDLNARIKSTRTDIDLFDGSNLVLDANTGEFNCKSGDSYHTDGSLQATRATISLQGGTGIDLTGSVSDLTLTGSDGSKADLEQLVVCSANIYLSDASYADMNINGRLTLFVHDSSKLVYIGNPTLGDKIDIDEGSKVERR